jgi:hypothetical protein
MSVVNRIVGWSLAATLTPAFGACVYLIGTLFDNK